MQIVIFYSEMTKLTFRFKKTPRFTKNFNDLEKKEQENVRKELKKLNEMPHEHICKRSPFLKGEFSGTRHYSFGRLRLYFRICKECRQLKHDTLYKRCDGCERKDDLINLIDVQIRKDNTYTTGLKNLDKEDAKSFEDCNETK